MTQLTLSDQLGIPEGGSKTFKNDAYAFLVAYSRASRGQPFSAEEVTQAALKAGIAPQDQRAWGAVFSRVAADGFIRRAREALFACSTSNGSLRPGWVGV